MQVVWVKNNQSGQWFDFLNLNLSAPYFHNRKGVYAIWYTNSQEAKVIRVGSGGIGDRLLEHRSNPEIIKYSQYGQLKVSWVILDGYDDETMRKIEAYVAKMYNPLAGERFPDYPVSESIEINLIGK